MPSYRPISKNELFQTNGGDNSQHDTYIKRLANMVNLMVEAKRLTPEAKDMWIQLFKILNKINAVIENPEDDGEKLYFDDEPASVEAVPVKLYEVYKVTQDEMEEYKNCCSGDSLLDGLHQLLRRAEKRMATACQASCGDDSDIEEEFQEDLEQMIEDLMCDASHHTGMVDFAEGGFEGLDSASSILGVHANTDKEHRMKLLHYLQYILSDVRWKMEHTYFGDGTDNNMKRLTVSTKANKDAHMVQRLMWKWIQLLHRMSVIAIEDYDFSKATTRDSCFDDDSVCCKSDVSCDRDVSCEFDDDNVAASGGGSRGDMVKDVIESLLQHCTK